MRQERKERDSLFQSTLPARGATVYAKLLRNKYSHFNPRSPHGERRARLNKIASILPFQSTLPARGATLCRYGDLQARQFQSTLPARGATESAMDKLLAKTFQSTLPARGATKREVTSASKSGNFNPRSPHGERPAVRQHMVLRWTDFNPRSPHGERQLHSTRTPPRRGHFNPRSPHGERR